MNVELAPNSCLLQFAGQMKTYWEQQALHTAEHVCGEFPWNDPNLLLNSGKERFASPRQSPQGLSSLPHHS